MALSTNLSEATGEEIKLPIITLQELLHKVVEQHANNVALICRHQASDQFSHITTKSEDGEKSCLRWTYAQLWSVVQRFAYKMHALGVRRGMRIVALLKHGAQYTIALYTAALLGCAFVPINATLADKSSEIQHILGTVAADVLLAWDVKMAKDLIGAAGNELVGSLRARVFCNDGDVSLPGWLYMGDMIAENSTAPAMFHKDHETDANDLSLILFTSGTTSKPKAVGKTNRVLVSSIRSHAQVQALDSSRKFCDNLPSFHVYGVSWMLAFWSVGGTVCFPSEMFDAQATLEAIQEEKLTNFAGVPTMYQAMIRVLAQTQVNLSSLLAVAVAGTMILPETLASISRHLGVKKISTSFGMTEASPVSSLAYEELPYEFKGDVITAGKCSPGVKVRICEPHSTNIVDLGIEGELHVGGVTVTSQYLGIDDTGDTFYKDNGCIWMRTGDQAVMRDHGEIFIKGRFKDIIIRGGENIAPASIESVIDTLPEVAVSQVVGVPDKVAGEVPFMVVKLADGATIDKDSVHDVVKEKLGTLYLPSETISLEDLKLEDFPKTSSGKIQKAELKGTVVEYLEARDGIPSPISETAEDSSILDGLHDIWSNGLGLSKERFTASTPVTDLADSITVMRALHQIKRRLKQTLSVRDVAKYPTIESQAQLLSERGQSAPPETEVLEPSREGPPHVEDMVHTLGSQDSAQETKMAFENVTRDMDLTWDDVEDVVPIWDFGQVLSRRLRSQSWNHRHAWKSTVDSTRLRSALEKALSYHPMLRTMAIQPTGLSPLFCIVRPSSRWFQLVITEVEAIDTAESLRTLYLNDSSLDFAAVPGPLFRAIIAPIRSGGSGLVYQAQHSCFDGLSLPNLGEDLKAILSDSNTTILPRASYKLLADTYFLHRNSIQAQTSVTYHVNRLQGLKTLPSKSFWPFQRAPEWFKGNFSDASSNLIKARPLLDGPDGAGVDGVTLRTQLPHIQSLKQTHGISTPAIFKTALAILNCHYTRQNHAIFTNYDAARTWPFLEPWIAERLPDPMDINGPTFEAVLNMIEINPQETCLDLLRKIDEEQKLLSKHAHAPLFDIQKGLGRPCQSEDEQGLAKDINLISIMRRQIFNWLPSIKSVADASEETVGDVPLLKRIQVQSRSDVGILWNCGMLDETTFHMNASYDDAQLRRSEVEEAVKKLFWIAEWISEPGNLDVRMRECGLLG